MKLELKHIAPYLPYKILGKGRYGKFYLDTFSNMRGSGIESRTIDVWLNEQYKPILRPLSDLTKEIEGNGEKFVPIEEINEHSEYNLILGDSVLIDYENLFWKDLCVLNMLNVFEIYDLMQKLFEWHFDVFDLIKSGLAIDINTIQND